MSDVKEIEVKARVQNVDELLRKIEELGVTFGSTLTQYDRVFLPNGTTIKEITAGVSALRIRIENGSKTIFTLKQRQNVELSAIEAEVEIVDGESLPALIQLLGYYEVLSIHKKRRKAEYKEYEICLDEVEGLGSFIEIQKFSSEDGEKIQNELFDFLKQFGIKDSDRERKGYDTLIDEKKI